MSTYALGTDVVDHRMDGDVKSYAIFDSSRRYRYVLCRSWDIERSRLCFVMLNPSTATADKNDPTVTRCLHYAETWGYGSLMVMNLFAYRATDPKELKLVADAVGPNTDAYLSMMSEATTVVAAWGAHGRLYGRDQTVLKLLKRPIYVLELTTHGLPSHPLYKKSSLTKKVWVA